MDSWPAVLDEMERRLCDAEVSMEAGEFRFEAVDVPASLGPLPAIHRDRAERLRRDTLDAERRVEAAMAVIREREGGRSLLPQVRPVPAYFDRRA